MTAPAQQYFTVWDLAKEQLALAVTCRRCDHRATVQPTTLAAGRHGHNYPLSQAKARLKCSECGAKGEMLKIDVVGR
jgi:DNA-directed RNA polymerase subunit RPC12/RpoP